MGFLSKRLFVCKEFKTASQEQVFDTTQASLGRDQIEEYAPVVVLQIR
jgi:hypothetical protein